MYNNETRFVIKILMKVSHEKLTQDANQLAKEMQNKHFSRHDDFSNFEQINKNLFIGFFIFEQNRSKICFSSTANQILISLSSTSYANLEKEINSCFYKQQLNNYYPTKITFLKSPDSAEISVMIGFTYSNMKDECFH